MMFSSEKNLSIVAVSSEEDAVEDRQFSSDERVEDFESKDPDAKKRKVENEDTDEGRQFPLDERVEDFESKDPDAKKRKVENDTPERPTFSDVIDPTELRVIIVGHTGNGKSATGNTILGRAEFRSSFSAVSITKVCQLGMKTRFGRKLVVVDTPGLYDTGMTNEQVTKEIAKCIGMTAPGPHAILLTVNLSQRFTGEEQNVVKHLVDQFGNGMHNYLIVVFTNADALEYAKVDIRDYVNNTPESLQTILKLCDHRYISFNNRLSGDSQEQQVKNLISMVDENVQSKGGFCYTNEMYEAAEKTLRCLEENMKRKLKEEERSKI